MILDRILAAKREAVAAARAARPLSELRAAAAAAPPVRDFAGAIRRGRGAPVPIRAIAEVKRASPSAGVLREPFDPAGLGAVYAEAGAKALSVLTDGPFFQGAPEHLGAARRASGLPTLRKDFILDPYQVYETRALGADALLLIVAAVEPSLLRELLTLSGEIGLAALTEVHTTTELETALGAGARILGINNRDLRTFRVDLSVTYDLLPKIPPEVPVVSESGIASRADVARLEAAGVDAVLVGEALLRAESPGAALRALLGGAWSG
ncbi:MAG TPA: indole-3-glycerol phosphate synthase TrpC [Candidatus Methylomirabilis sp.]|nr:indole-3-glycerol phosphate synthase TrpC [Candidatus Methylomirabilis sp.]